MSAYLSTLANRIIACASAALLACLVVSCSDHSIPESAIAPTQQRENTRTLYIAKRIWTADTSKPLATAMLVDADTFVAVGDVAALVERYPDAQLRELPGELVVPGFADNHTHFMDGATELLAVDTYNARSKEAFIKVIADYAPEMGIGKWMTGGIWDHESWGGELPTRQWIDEYTAQNPVFLLRLDGHMGLANTRALQLAGITEATPDPTGGTIVRDVTGQATGVLKDNAMNLVFDVIPPLNQAEQDRIFDEGMLEAVSHGVTQIHNMGRWEDLFLFKRAKGEGRQPVRVFFYAPIANRQQLAEMIAAEGAGDDHLSWDGVKELTDGSLGSTTAWFYEPYADDAGTNGFPLMPFENYETSISEVHDLGLKLAIHAIGDQANDRLLDIFERLGPYETAPRIEHAQHLSAAAIDRFAEIGVTASMQPYHAIDDGRWAEKRIGAQRLQGTYAFKSLLEAGATLTFGSDWSVAPLDPIAGIYAAVTRRTLDDTNPQGWIPSEKIGVEEALTAYTLSNAKAVGREDILGSISAGKLADFVVLDADLLSIEPEKIRETRVLETYVGGQLQYPLQPEQASANQLPSRH